MLPFAFEWHWDLGHVVFFGLFYSALIVIAFNVVQALFFTFADLYFPKKGGSAQHDDED